MPPRPKSRAPNVLAKEHKNAVKRGTDGKMYVSKCDSIGRYRWYPFKTVKTVKAVKRGGASPTPYPPSFINFVEFHGIPKARWSSLFKDGIDIDDVNNPSHDWEALLPRVMYWPQAKVHILERKFETPVQKKQLINIFWDLDKGNVFLKKNFDTSSWKRGDIIQPFYSGDRDLDKAMWDGKQAIRLYKKFNDYGSVCAEFAVPEFPPNYWNGFFDYDQTIPVQFDAQVAKELNAWYKENKDSGGKYIFMYNGRKWAFSNEHDCQHKPPLSPSGFGGWYPYLYNTPRPRNEYTQAFRKYDIVKVPVKLKPFVELGVPPENVMSGGF